MFDFFTRLKIEALALSVFFFIASIYFFMLAGTGAEFFYYLISVVCLAGAVIVPCFTYKIIKEEKDLMWFYILEYHKEN